MELEFINRIIKSTLLFGLCSFLALTVYIDFFSGLALFLGAIWGCVNLLFIKYLVQSTFDPGPKSYRKILTVMGVKFPLLYAIGYWLLTNDALPPFYLVAGSASVFGMIFLYPLKNLLSRTSVFLIALASSAKLHASLEGDVPEIPNFLTLLYKHFDDVPWISFLHEWENIIFSIIIAVIVSLVFYFGSRKKKLIPSGFQNFLEWTVETLRNFIVGILGPEGEKFVPLLGTLFIYILTMNWFVLIPLMKAPSSSINITIALAVCVFAVVQYLNFKNWGFKGFLYHMAGSPKNALGWAMVPLMFPIELLTQLTRPLTLSLRLFGNVVGEDILIGAAALFGVYLLSNLDIHGGLPVQVPFMFLALLTGLMQALVFTLLSTIYILLSMPHVEDKTH